MSVDNIFIGPCFVTFKGTDLGYTKGGVKVEMSTTTRPIMLAQDGDEPRNIYVTGRHAVITVPMAETTAQRLSDVMPGVSLVGDKATVSGLSGTDLLTLAGELVCGFIDETGSQIGVSTFPKTICTGEVSYAHHFNQERVFELKFLAYPSGSNVLFTLDDA